MKNTLLAAAAVLGLTATVASAESLLPVPVIGSLEYAFEADVASMDLGTRIDLGVVTLTPMINAAYDTDLRFTGAELTASYLITEGLDVYATIESDSEWEYSEFTIGMSFSF